MHPTRFHSRFHLRGVLASLAILALAGAAAAEENVYPQLVRSTAWVVTPLGSGSGILVDRKERLVATNFHVVGLAPEVKVLFPDRQGGNIVAERKYYAENLDRLAIKGTVVRRDPRRDLALVRLERIPDDADAIKVADKGAAPGQHVYSDNYLSPPGDNYLSPVKI